MYSDQHLKQLENAIFSAEKIVILTGAGVSVASGIAPFRKSSDALWERNVTELATRRYFEACPSESWEWYRARFGGILDKLPNPTHQALVELEDWCETNETDYVLITQNIDLLHRKAGSRALIEIHGRADLCRCVNPQCELAAPRGLIQISDLDFQGFDQLPSIDTLPRCPQCSALVRPHILWFDERYTDHEAYQYESALNAFETADLLLCLGTSFSVGITESALYFSELSGAEVWTVDPAPLLDFAGMHTITGKSEALLPELMNRLRSRES